MATQPLPIVAENGTALGLDAVRKLVAQACPEAEYRGRRVQPGTDKAKDLQQRGAALAPPEYRDGYKGFTEDVSKSGRTPQDK